MVKYGLKSLKPLVGIKENSVYKGRNILWDSERNRVLLQAAVQMADSPIKKAVSYLSAPTLLCTFFLFCFIPSPLTRFGSDLLKIDETKEEELKCAITCALCTNLLMYTLSLPQYFEEHKIN